MSDDSALPPATNFIREIINDDLRAGRHGNRVVTRFPPEPNGYPHLGHAKSICLNFGIAEDYADVADTRCHLRFDDTNPETESEEYVNAIKEAVQWLGYDWDAHCYHAADYFEQFYDFAVQLVEQGDAYVDSQTEEEIREHRGTVNEPGTPSPYRDRSVEENLDLLQRMREGEFDDGEHVLRAKIDMASPHMIMRDPLLLRIKHAHHYRRGDDWCLYPMYDFAHPLEDAIEDITHSLCTLEFDNNRRVYDWLLERCLPEEEHESRPHQYEFSRLNVGYTVMSKRKLLQLVERGDVAGWDDPRLPTLAGLRRRGVPPAAIRAFCDDVGVTRTESRVQISRFEHAIRDTLNTTAPRVMAVVDPLKVVLTNYSADDTTWMDLPSWPHDIDNEGSRRVPFSRTLYIERDDFREDPPEDFYRLSPGTAVRLRNSYVITCERVVRNDDGTVKELHCTYDPTTKGNVDPVDGPTPKGVIHWVDAQAGIPFEARLYDRLFTVPAPDGGDEDFKTHLNPDSLQVHEGVVEPSILDNPDTQRYQFERVGYFWQDPEDSTRDALVFNQIVPLRDRWADDGDTVDLEAERKAKEKAKRKQRERSIAAQRDPAEQLSEAERAVYEQYHRELGLTRDGAALLAGDEPLRTFFQTALDHYDAPQAIANWIVNELQAARKDQSLIDLPFDAAQFADLVRLVDTEVITNRAARDIFGRMMAEGGDPAAIVEEEGLEQIDDADALREAAQQVIDDNPDEATRFRNGEQQLMGFFMGQIMRATNGSADPQEAQAALREVLSDA
ncbi:glutamine--tRNA ligase/YqeY domain fusion protein [Longimonas halophila]|uniref:glutamine--tRNA ligase/YqeY domain fusion protein n=1 Tax=Longimonas halophila TaxID=1469170 RepID=UPI00159648E6|nr:glutamine--tRNA ligase/YqeY domain fusion protein [Longimonas halophila]